MHVCLVTMHTLRCQFYTNINFVEHVLNLRKRLLSLTQVLIVNTVNRTEIVSVFLLKMK